MSFSYYDSELGKIKIEVEDKYIIGVNFVSDIDLPMDEINNENEKSIISKCKNQLEEYFNGERKNFELEIGYVSYLRDRYDIKTTTP